MHCLSCRYWLYVSYEWCFLLGCGLFPVETLALENPVFDYPALGGVLCSTFNQPRIWLANFTSPHYSYTSNPPFVWIQSCYGSKEYFGRNIMNLLDCMGQPAVAETVWPPGGLKFLAPLVLYSTVDHTNSRESNPPMELRCLM
jgi:hypothetical protein